MNRVYKAHRWVSLISLIFFTMFCITGLFLLFRAEIYNWNEGKGFSDEKIGYQTDKKAMINYLWNHVDEGAFAIHKAFPEKKIHSIYAQSISGELRFFLYDEERHQRMTALYNPSSREIKTVDKNVGEYPFLKTWMSVARRLHMQLMVGKAGMIFLGGMSLLCAISVITGAFLYAPFMSAMRRRFLGITGIVSIPRRCKWGAWHQELAMASAIFALTLSISGAVMVGTFLVRNDYERGMEREVQQKWQAPSNQVPLSVVVKDISTKYENQSLIMLYTPSQNVLRQYKGRIGLKHRENPISTFSQPIYAHYESGTEGELFSQEVPLIFPFAMVMLDLHLHNHECFALRLLWGIWTILLVVGMWMGLFVTGIRTKRIAENTSFVAVSKRHTLWSGPIVWNLSILIGLFIPLYSFPYANEIAIIAFTVPLVWFLWRRIKIAYIMNRNR